MLAGNAAFNGADAVKVHFAALGAEAGVVEIPRLDDGSGSLGSAMNLVGSSVVSCGNDRIETVPMLRMDDALADIPALRLIKVDVEGMEAEVLAGVTGMIARHRPYLYLEVNDHAGGEALIAGIKAMRYRVYWNPQRAFNPDN